MRVSDLMSTEVVNVTVPSDRRAALRLMAKHSISGLPVLDVKGNLVGMVTRKDIFRKSSEEQLALLMTADPVTVSPSDSAAEAARLMVEGGFQRLPVVEGGELVGIVTPTDLMLEVEKSGTGTVREYLEGKCVPVHQSTPLPALAAIIHASQVYALPVLDDRGILAGIVTDGDMFLKGDVDEAVIRSDLGMGEDEDSWTWEGLRNIMKLYYIRSKIALPDIPIGDIAVKDVLTVYNETPIRKAAHTMRVRGIGQMPVLEASGALCGMLFSKDLLRWFLRGERGRGGGRR